MVKQNPQKWGGCPICASCWWLGILKISRAQVIAQGFFPIFSPVMQASNAQVVPTTGVCHMRYAATADAPRPPLPKTRNSALLFRGLPLATHGAGHHVPLETTGVGWAQQSYFNVTLHAGP